MQQPLSFRRPPPRQLSTSRLAGLLAGAFVAAAVVAFPAVAADVGVSVHISQPGTYGRIDIGRVPPPPPALVYAQPILVQPPPVVAAPPQPVYLWVPPGHQKDWKHQCRRYGACGVPVYFVQDRWYREQWLPARGGPRPGYAPAPGYGPVPVRRDDRDWKRDEKDWKHAEKEQRKHEREERKHGRADEHGHGHHD